jgi:ATP-dependent Clp protease ATP-binding subunit ClpA
MFERFTEPARTVVTDAQEEARGLGHGWIGTEHLLIAVLRTPEESGAATLAAQGLTAQACREAVREVVAGDDDGLGPRDAEALQAFGIDLEEVRRRTEETFGPGALDATHPAEPAARRGMPFRRRRKETGRTGHVPFTPRAKKALELALREAVALRDRHIGVEHLVLALLRSDDRLTRAMWDRLSVRPGDARARVLSARRKAA